MHLLTGVGSVNCYVLDDLGNAMVVFLMIRRKGQFLSSINICCLQKFKYHDVEKRLMVTLVILQRWIIGDNKHWCMCHHYLPTFSQIAVKDYQKGTGSLKFDGMLMIEMNLYRIQ